MFVGRVAAVELVNICALEHVAGDTYACAKNSRPRPVTDFDIQVIL